MNITIENKELSINTVSELMAAQNKLLEAFAESLVGTRESLKAELKAEVREEVEQELVDKAGVGSIEELNEWLDDMRLSGYIGKDGDEIKSEVMQEAFQNTDYEDVEEMQDAIEDMQRAFECVYDEIREYI